MRGFLFYMTAPALALGLAACSTPTVVHREVKVPVPVPCEIAQVPRSEMPQVRADMNIFELTQVALARIGLLEAENERLRAANANPCTTPKENN